MLLSLLIDACGATVIPDPAGDKSRRTILDVVSDSRLAQPSCLFVALAAEATARWCHIDEALAKGAVAVLVPLGGLTSEQVGVLHRRHCTVLEAPHVRHSLALLAATFYRRQPSQIVAVTGTNGKSSVASFVRQLWSMEGRRAANLGTLGLEAPDLVSVPHPSFPLTTPDPIALHRYLDVLAQHSIDVLAMEASSHGLDQHRLDGVCLSAAAFTNLSQDHLDYHGDMTAYFQAKRRLFSELLPPGATAVLNRDIPEFEALHHVCGQRGHRIIDFGQTPGAALSIHAVVPLADGGQRVTFGVRDQSVEVDVPLVGDFQVWNLAAALGLFEATGGNVIERLRAGLGGLKSVLGRMQFVGHTACGAQAFIDYAHTPDALKAVVKALRRSLAQDGRLIVVMGCGGDRDVSKRRIMGQVSHDHADLTIVTDDNPRTEIPEKIRAQVLAGFDDTSKVLEIGDRRRAIECALEKARAHDIVLVAGKGHEKGQIMGHDILPFDDAEVIRSFCAMGEASGSSFGGV